LVVWIPTYNDELELQQRLPRSLPILSKLKS